MDNLDHTCASLRAQVAATESDLARLKRELHDAEEAASNATNGETTNNSNGKRSWPLLPEEYKRYGRQMIVPQLGLQGELDSVIYADFGLIPLVYDRATSTSFIKGFDSRSRRVRMSSWSVSGWSWSWHVGDGRWGYG